MKEREINIIDFMVDILLHWRSIIVWMLVGAILVGGFAYVSSVRTVAAQKAAWEQQKIEREEEQALLEEQMKDKDATKEELIKNLTETQKNNVQNIVQYGVMKDFYKDSFYLQMKAEKVPKAELSFLVKTSVSGDNYSIERLYEDTLESGLQQWLADNGLDSLGDVSELVSFDRATNAIETDSFNVQVIHVSEEMCKKLAKAVSDYIEDRQTLIAKQAGRHEIVLVNQTFAFVRDNVVMDQQKILWSYITSIDAATDSAIKAFTEEEKEYYEFLTNIKLIEEEEETVIPDDDAEEEKDKEIVHITPRFSIKYIILGMIIFAFMWVFWLSMKYVLNNKLRANDDIKAIYKVPQLGRVSENTFIKKPFGFVDRLILQLRDRNRRSFTREESIGLAGVAVKIAVRKESFDAVCCLGCDMKERSLEVAEAMQKVLHEDGIAMTVLNNVLYDQSAMECLQSVKGAFLLEKAGETLYVEILKELELLNRQGIKVLGVVVVE